MKRLQVAFACLLGMWMSGAAYAHHSMEGFDRDKNVTLSGTVKQFKWANPHSWIELEVPNDNGAVETWNIEMTAPFVLIRAGWRAIVPQARRQGHRGRAPAKERRARRSVRFGYLANGSTLTDRPPAAAPAAK